jgi:hypothetical protein
MDAHRRSGPVVATTANMLGHDHADRKSVGVSRDESPLAISVLSRPTRETAPYQASADLKFYGRRHLLLSLAVIAGLCRFPGPTRTTRLRAAIDQK